MRSCTLSRMRTASMPLAVLACSAALPFLACGGDTFSRTSLELERGARDTFMKSF